MNFFLNESGRDQVFLIDGYREVVPNRYGFTSRFAGRFLSEPRASKDLTRFKDFKAAGEARSDGKIVLHRTSALGDVLMMFALAGELPDAACSFDRQRFSEIAGWYSPDLGGRIGIILDGEVEADHVDSPVPTKHRVDMMAEAMGFAVGDVAWDLPFEVPDESVEKFDVLVQCGGSTPMKQLHPLVLRPAISALAARGLRVGLIGSSKEFGCPKGAEDLRGGTTLSRLWNTIKACGVLVTHDSGPLWISHFTHTKTVLLCGPTHHESRLSRHPAETAFIDLSRMVGCRPCGETGRRCSEVDCMSTKIPVKSFEDELFERIDRLL